MDAEALALKNLKVIAKAVGADLGTEGHFATIKIGEYLYRISPGTIERQPAKGLSFGTRRTCLQTYGNLPYPEMIAATLLLLKNDPTLFDKWCQQDGYYA